METLITGSVTLLCLSLALLLGWRPLRRLLLARRRQKLITGYGLARLDNVVLDDGIGGHSVLEHVLLTSAGLLVLLPRHCDGALFGGDKIDSWTQMVGSKSFHFDNPLHQLEELLAALRFQLPGIPVEGRVLFSGHCRFPKGRPGRLLLLEEMSGQEGRVAQAVLPVIEEAWHTLQGQPRAEAASTRTGGSAQQLRIWLSLLLAVASALWLGWRLT